jgi:hypothetical protein
MLRKGAGLASTSEAAGCFEPPPAEVRFAIERIAVSRAFRSAPKLAAFLRFVVERTLAGDSAHIKGYTIATEALGRDASFDPAVDPIVRVEAGRLRRALARYYAEEGRGDEIVIELARGSYVPTFRSSSQAAPGIFGRLRTFARPVNFQAHRYLTAAALVALGAGLFVAADFVIHYGLPVRQVSASSYDGPVLYVEPITIVGTPGPDTISVVTLHDRLVDVLVRFDDVNIVSGPASLAVPATNSRPGEAQSAKQLDYRLATLVRFYADRSASLMFRLIDATDSTVVWSQSFDGLRPTDQPMAMKARVLRAVAMPLLQPFGVVHARERIKLANADPPPTVIVVCSIRTTICAASTRPGTRPCAPVSNGRLPTIRASRADLSSSRASTCANINSASASSRATRRRSTGHSRWLSAGWR